MEPLVEELERLAVATVDEWKDANIGVLLPAVLLDGIEKQRRKLQDLEGYLTAKIGGSFTDEGMRLPSGRTLQVHSSKNRRSWQHEEIRSAWMTKVYEEMVNKETGEEPSPQEYAARVLEGPTISGWKVTPLKAVEIDVDDYCDYSYGAPIAQFGD